MDRNNATGDGNGGAGEVTMVTADPKSRSVSYKNRPTANTASVEPDSNHTTWPGNLTTWPDKATVDVNANHGGAENQEAPLINWEDHNHSHENHSHSLHDESDTEQPIRTSWPRPSTIILMALLLLLFLATGFFLGYYLCNSLMEEKYRGPTPNQPDRIRTDQDVSEDKQSMLDNLNHLMSVHKEIHDNVGKYERQHIGLSTDDEVVQSLKSELENAGFPHVIIDDYSVRMSRPSGGNNVLRLLSKNGTDLKVTQDTAATNNVSMENPFVPYSPNCTALKASIVYVHYGRLKDIRAATRRSVSLAGRIVLLRWGREALSAKLSALAAHQVAGALVYFAEDDAAGDCDSSVPMIPTVMYGDPFSPGTVTNEGSRWTATYSDDLLPMPVHPVSCEEANKILDLLNGPEAPESWKNNVTDSLKIGGRSDDEASWLAELTIHNILKPAVMRNVIGVISGWQYPDEYVLVSVTRPFSSDLHPALSLFSDLVDALSKPISTRQWIPRRTLVLAVWDPASHGELAAIEYIEGSVAGLSGRIALHISLDCPLVGNAQAAGDGRTLHAVCPHSLRPILQKLSSWQEKVDFLPLILPAPPGDQNIQRPPKMNIQLISPELETDPFLGPLHCVTSGDLVSDLGNMSRVVTQLMLTMTDTMLLPHDVTESVNELYDLVTMDTLPSLPFEAHDWLLNLTVSLQRSARHFSLYKDHQHYSYLYSHELSQMSHINQAVMMSETLMETVRPLMMKIRYQGELWDMLDEFTKWDAGYHDNIDTASDAQDTELDDMTEVRQVLSRQISDDYRRLSGLMTTVIKTLSLSP